MDSQLFLLTGSSSVQNSAAKRCFFQNRKTEGKNSGAFSLDPWRFFVFFKHILEQRQCHSQCQLWFSLTVHSVERINDWEDTHAIANPNLIYKNNQLRRMKYTQTVHKYTYSFSNPQTENVYQHGAHSLICSISVSHT